MKRIALVIMMLLMTVFLVACGDKVNNDLNSYSVYIAGK